MSLFKKKPMTAEDIDLESLDKETNTRKLSGIPNVLITICLVFFTLFQIYSSIRGTVPTQILRMIHLAFVVPLCYWLYPATSKGEKDKMSLVDILLGFLFLGIVSYYLFNFNALLERIGFYTTTDLIIGGIGILLVVEACRRVSGGAIVIIATIFTIYAYFGSVFPGFLKHKGYSITRIISQLFYSTEGIMGTPLGVCATFVFLFILFGAFLEKTGIGEFFNDFSNAVAGSKAGGPAKVAVISSALEGTVSGSSISNVMGSGSFTIPMMKSLGYSSEFAGAVEAAASTGGQIMPPIMGAAAFLIAELLGIPYIEVIKAAIVPAILYFTGIYIAVDLTAKKEKLIGIPKDQMPNLKLLVIEKGHLIIPLVIIIGFLAVGFTITRAALWGIASTIVVPQLRKTTRIPIRELSSRIGICIVNGAKGILGVSCACAVAGIIVGVVTMTGLGLKLGEGLISLTQGHLIPTLFFTMITCLILGMGVPTTANYLITSTIAAPILMKLGVPILSSHLFVFYFGILSDITPPVALAAYAGAAISKGNPFKTGVIASKLAIGGFIVPYMFVLDSQMLLIDVSLIQLPLLILSAIIGMIGISSAMFGYLLDDAKWHERILLAVGGLMLVYPESISDIIGLIIIGSIYLKQKKQLKHLTNNI